MERNPPVEETDIRAALARIEEKLDRLLAAPVPTFDAKELTRAVSRTMERKPSLRPRL